MVWIANAAACWTGAHGDVTQQAEAADCSRQTVSDHARKVHDAVEAKSSGGPTRAELSQENQRLRHENSQLWDWLRHSIAFPPGHQQEFPVTVMAMGLSLNYVLALRALVLGVQARPSRSILRRDVAQRGAGRDVLYDTWWPTRARDYRPGLRWCNNSGEAGSNPRWRTAGMCSPPPRRPGAS